MTRDRIRALLDAAREPIVRVEVKRYAEDEGDFRGPWEPAGRACPACDGPILRRRVWESRDGGYVDVKFCCFGCSHVFWIEGPDA